MSYKEGIDKQQLVLLPVSLDEYVPEDPICRVIEAFIKQLDMRTLGYKYAEYKDTGSRPYDPRMMLGLYLYGYLHRIGSSRRLEAETGRNVEVMWLMNGLRPDDKTISNFRSDNAKAIRATFREFTRMCLKLGLYGKELVAVDGTKFRANNSRKNNHNATTIEQELTRIEKKVNEYLVALDEADAGEREERVPTKEQIREALKKLNERKELYEGFKGRLEAEKVTEISTVDPEARLMKQGGDARPLDVSYNVQTVVDAQQHLLVDFEVIDRSDDHGNLKGMTEKAQEVLGVTKLTALGDKGYYDGEDIVACEAAGVTVLVAKPAPGGAKKEEECTHDRFVYDSEKNCYVCPGKHELSYMRKQKHSNDKEYYVYANYAACGRCEKKGMCTTGKYRQILRPLYQDKLDVVDKRTKENKELYRKRQEIVEHPFGTVKAVWGYKPCLCRGNVKVTAEIALAYLAYNLRRMITIYQEKRESILMAMSA